MNKINDKNIMSVAERLKLIAEENDLSLRKLSVSIGKTPGYLSASINKGTEVGSDALAQILVSYPKYNIVWVLTGEGEKLQKSSSEVNDSDILYQTQTAGDQFEKLVTKIVDAKYGPKLKDLEIKVKGLAAIASIASELEKIKNKTTQEQ